MSWLQLARAVFRRDPQATDYQYPPAYGPADLSGAGLTKPQERVIRLRFALEPESFTLEEVGQIMCISRERVRQMEAAALEKMRKAVGTREGEGEGEGSGMKRRSAFVALSESQIELILSLLELVEITVPGDRRVRIEDDLKHISEQCRVALMALDITE